MIRVLTIGAWCLGGCAAIDTATTSMLSQVNPLMADPGDYTVVIGLPPGLGLEQNGASLGIQAQYRDQSLQRTFYLEQIGLADGGLALVVKPDDLPVMRALQKQARDWEAASPRESSGSISANVTPCYTGSKVPEDGKVSISIRASQEGPLMPLMRPYSAHKLIDRLEKEAGGQVKTCGA